MIKKCDCVSEFQDGRYGKGNRYHTPMSKDRSCCTVCGKIKSR